MKFLIFRFPSKNMLLTKKWVIAMKRKDFIPNECSFICSEHFIPEDYESRPFDGRKTLKANAIPSVFTSSEHLILSDKECQIPACRSSSPISKPSSITNFQNDHCYISSTVTSKSAKSPSEKILKRKIKSLQQQVRHQYLQIVHYKDVINKLTDEKLIREHSTKILHNNFSGMALQVFENEIKNGSTAQNGRRYSDEIKKFALTMNSYSPEAYNYLRQIFTLPSIKNLGNDSC